MKKTVKTFKNSILWEGYEEWIEHGTYDVTSQMRERTQKEKES